MAKHRTARQWASIIESYERSGLTQADFCRRRALALSTLSNRLRRHRLSSRQSSEGSLACSSPASALLEIVAAASTLDLEPAVDRLDRPEDTSESCLDVRIELPPELRAVAIHCQRRHLGEVLLQISSLPIGS